MTNQHPEHLHYEPSSELKALLVWQDDAGSCQSSVKVSELSAEGCALIDSQGPDLDHLAVIALQLAEDQPAVKFQARVTSRNHLGESWLIALRFEHVSAQQAALLMSALASAAFRPAKAEHDQSRRKFWRVPQWAAYLAAQQLPVMPRSKLLLTTLAEEKGDDLSANDLADLANGDPFLCLCLLREAEKRRSTRLGHETTTPLSAAMQLGIQGFQELLNTSPETDETNTGLAHCEVHAAWAGQLAATWSSARSDVSPDEVLMAALLAEMGELLLWHFAPELPQAALDALASGKAHRTVEAQELACGFKFKDLTLKCVEIWKLPAILVQLIRGTDTARANIARLCIDTTRHLIASSSNPALPDDLASAKHLIPHASLEWLAAGLQGLSEEMRRDLVEKAGLVRHHSQQ